MMNEIRLLMNDIRLYICELLLRLILKIVPRNKEGKALVLSIHGYFVWLRERWKFAGSDAHWFE